MKRFLTLALVGAVMLGAGSVAYANVCAFDPVPAATLLFPFVTYNYTLEDAGYNTLFAVTNVSNEATIAHVTVWTDWSFPLLDFNILLTGYDVQTMSIRDILRDGQLPVTVLASHNKTVLEDGPVAGGNPYAAFDPPNLPNPQDTNDLGGDRCQASWDAYPGKYEDNPIPPAYLDYFQGFLQASQIADRAHQNCDSSDPYVPEDAQGNMPWFEARTASDDTWMYITIDVVETCSKVFPDEGQYYSEELRFENILMGDVIYVNQTARLSEAENAVQIEADGALPFITTLIGNEEGDWASFYARYADRFGLDDYREPLPTAWAFRYMQDPDIGLSTLIRAWKGSTTLESIPDLFVYHPVIDLPPVEFWAKNCLAYTYYVWDEDENVSTSSQYPWSGGPGEPASLNLFPLETQEVSVDMLNTIDPYGWMLFIWPNSNFAGPEVGGDWYQTWMGVQYAKVNSQSGEPEYSAFRNGHVMANYNCFSSQVLPDLGFFFRPPLD